MLVSSYVIFFLKEKSLLKYCSDCYIANKLVIKKCYVQNWNCDVT